MHIKARFLWILLLLLVWGGCRQNLNTSSTGAAATGADGAQAVYVSQRPDGWDEYWYSGLAEINKYTTTQSRYGEDRAGTAVLVWVTEPFLPDTQVKDDGVPTKETSVSVLKLNRIERFTTGIYDYSIMQSIFTPVSRDQYPHTLKTTISVQDWCGQVWSQYNFRKGAYEVEHRSYFQREGDVRETLPAVLLEDELPTLVRLDPTHLPAGKLRAIPSEKFARLFHVPAVAQDAILTVAEGARDGDIDVLLEFPELQRSVAYKFSAAFPHRLLRWRETYKGEQLMEATLEHTLHEPYWSQNKRSFAPMRDSLGL